MQRGFLYLVAIMDWCSRKVLAWWLSNSMDADFCIEALKDAMVKHGPPQIMNSDQGSQFTGHDWTNALSDAGVNISMDGRGRWIAYYNAEHPHSAHGILTPNEAYEAGRVEEKIAA